MLQAWARICSSIGDAFIPYLTVVMPPLMRSASIKPDVQISNGIHAYMMASSITDEIHS